MEIRIIEVSGNIVHTEERTLLDKLLGRVKRRTYFTFIEGTWERVLHWRKLEAKEVLELIRAMDEHDNLIGQPAALRLHQGR